MTLSLAALAAPVVVPIVLALPSVPVDDQEARWYDLRAIVSAGAYTHPGVILDLHLTTSAIDALEPDRKDLPLGDEPSLSIDDCVSAIRAAIATDPAAELTDIEARAGLVRVNGNEAAQNAAARAVDALGDVCADSVDVEVYRVDDAELPGDVGAVLDAAQARTLVAGFERATTSRNAARIGRATSLGAEDTTTYLYGYDVEVAQGSVAPDPIVTILRTGLDVGVRVDRASDGRRLVVRVWGRDGAIRQPIASQEITALGRAPIELPRVGTSVWTSSAILEPGGAIVIDHDGGGRASLVVRVAPDADAPTPEAMLPLGELALSPMRPKLPRLSKAAPSGGWPRHYDNFLAASAPWMEDGAGIEAFVSGALEETISNNLAFPFGSGVLLPAPDAVPDSARSAINDLRKGAPVETIALDVRYDFLAASEAREVLADGGLDAFASKASGRLLGSGIENDALLLVGGEEYAYIQDHDAQVAAGAMIPNPIVNEAFEGIAVWCAPLRNPNGKMTAWFDVQAHAPVDAARTIDAVTYKPMRGDGDKNDPVAAGTFLKTLSIQLPTTHRASARTLVQADEGEWSLVAMQPVDGSERTLVVAARLTSR